MIKSYGCHSILDNHNVEAQLFWDNKPVNETLKSKLNSKIQFNKIKSIENDFIKQVNHVWMCSAEDNYLLSNFYGKNTHSNVVPNAIDVASYDYVRLHECNSQTELNIFFAGTFIYPPNEVAAQLLIDEIYPRLRKIHSNSRLILLGRYPTLRMLEAAKQDPQIIVTGQVEDVRPYLLSASIVVIPLLQGGGTRLKILEAFAAGRPVISTAKGAEGLKVVDGKHLLIRNNVEEIITGVCELWTQPNIGERLARNAYELVKAEYSWQAASLKIEESLQEILY